jgi:hypothetical protein
MINLKEENFNFGSWFKRFQNTINWFGCFGPVLAWYKIVVKVNFTS